MRSVIQAFLADRLIGRLEKLAEDDPKRAEIIEMHQPLTWIEDAAKRVSQIQSVTHSLKPIHPEARGTNLYVMPSVLPDRSEVGTHSIGNDFAADVVGNAAALDVYKFLKLDVGGRTLLDALVSDEPAALRTLHQDEVVARGWRDAFVSLTQSVEAQASSHVRAKQLYWLVGDNPGDDSQYHLLAPLYATSLAHVVYGVIQEDRFSDESKAARQARRDKKFHEGVVRDYPNLAVQKLGGAKPQNISQLNSERRGNNYLLSCAPPAWKSSQLRRPFGLTSIFDRIYGARDGVKATVSSIERFLLADPEPNAQTRDRLDGYIDQLIDELVQLAGEYQQNLPPGWTCEARVRLVDAEKLWLDPRRAELPGEEAFLEQWLWQDWPEQIGRRFANWLNTRLEGRLAVGDAEMRHWKKELLVDERDGGWAQHLHRLRRERGSPAYISTRGVMG